MLHKIALALLLANWTACASDSALSSPASDYDTPSHDEAALIAITKAFFQASDDGRYEDVQALLAPGFVRANGGRFVSLPLALSVSKRVRNAATHASVNASSNI